MNKKTNLDMMIVSYFAGDLSEEQFAVFQDTLRSSALARRRFADIARQDILLHRLQTSQRASHPYDRFEDTANAKPRGNKIHWLPPLALAASLLVVAGLFRFLENDRHPLHASGRLTYTRGNPIITEISTDEAVITTIHTPPGSFCRFDHPDGSIMAVDENSKIEWRLSKADGSVTVDLARGQTYLDLALQTKGFHIHLPFNIQSQIVGTRLWVKPDSIHVLDGAIAIQRQTSGVGTLLPMVNVSAIIEAGQNVTAPPDKGLLVIDNKAGETISIPWAQQAGIDSVPHLDEPVAAIPLESPSSLDLSKAFVLMGDWRLENKAGSLRAHYTKTDQGAALVFGDYQWLKGELSYKVRLPEISSTDGAPSPTIGIALAYPFGGINANESRLIAAPAGVYLVRAIFELDIPKNQMMLRRMEVWPEGRRKAIQVTDENTVLYRLTKDDGIALQACAPGIYVSGVAAEFFDIRLDNAVIVPSREHTEDTE